MPQSKNSTDKPKQARWQKNSPVAAQLFRDIYFGKYKPHPKTGKDTAERVDLYKRNGSGLYTETFRRLCRLNEPPPPEDRAPEYKAQEEDDSTFGEPSDIEDDDITLGDFDEVESAFAELKINKEIKDVPLTQKAETKTTKRKTPTPKKKEEMPADTTTTKFSFTCADGRLAFVYHVPSGFDGTFELDESNTKVVKKEVVQNWEYDAVAVYSRLGLCQDNVHIVGLQAEMDNRKKKDIESMGKKAEEYHGETFHKSIAFEIGEEVEPYFIDQSGKETSDVWIDGADDGGEWVYFWLKKKIARKGGRTARLNRNRRRSCPSADSDEENESWARSNRRSSIPDDGMEDDDGL